MRGASDRGSCASSGRRRTRQKKAIYTGRRCSSGSNAQHHPHPLHTHRTRSCKALELFRPPVPPQVELSFAVGRGRVWLFPRAVQSSSLCHRCREVWCAHPLVHSACPSRYPCPTFRGRLLAVPATFQLAETRVHKRLRSIPPLVAMGKSKPPPFLHSRPRLSAARCCPPLPAAPASILNPLSACTQPFPLLLFLLFIPLIGARCLSFFCLWPPSSDLIPTAESSTADTYRPHNVSLPHPFPTTMTSFAGSPAEERREETNALWMGEREASHGLRSVVSELVPLRGVQQQHEHRRGLPGLFAGRRPLQTWSCCCPRLPGCQVG